MNSVFSEVSRDVSEKRRQITIIWPSLPILGKVLISTKLIPFFFALTLSILLTLVFVIPALFLISRWIDILTSDYFNTGEMKVPTFYSTSKDRDEDISFLCPLSALYSEEYTVQDGSSTFPPVTNQCCGGYLRRFLLVLPLYYLYFNTSL